MPNIDEIDRYLFEHAAFSFGLTGRDTSGIFKCIVDSMYAKTILRHDSRLTLLYKLLIQEKKRTFVIGNAASIRHLVVDEQEKDAFKVGWFTANPPVRFDAKIDEGIRVVLCIIGPSESVPRLVMRGMEIVQRRDFLDKVGAAGSDDAVKMGVLESLSIPSSRSVSNHLQQLSEAVFRKTARIANRRGLHARACAKFVQYAVAFDAEITVGKNGVFVDGRSIIGLMGLGAVPGNEIEIAAIGAEAIEAVEILCEVISRRFEED